MIYSFERERDQLVWYERLNTIIDEKFVVPGKPLKSGEELLIKLKYNGPTGYLAHRVYYSFQNMEGVELGTSGIPSDLDAIPIDQLKVTFLGKEMNTINLVDKLHPEGRTVPFALIYIKVEMSPKATRQIYANLRRR